ncbi:MAG: 4Fe-4S binding protein [Candidatus Lokiarchaeota archaeon]|nr:4Fe-4S binding protein [Candidatus Lokiarchaeota archaeon]
MVQGIANKTKGQPAILVDLPVVAVKIRINSAACSGCGTCAEVCPFGLPERSESGKYAISRPDLCTGCSACKKNCPENAVVMQEQKGCGCLWDVARRRKAGTKDGSCCG